MFKAIMLMFAPQSTWESIAQARRGVLSLFLLSALPLLLLGTGVEGYGLMKKGDAHGEFGRVTTVPKERLQRYVAVQTGLGILLLFGGAMITKAVCSGFNFFPPYQDCFRLITYGISPYFLFRAFDGLPSINTWICWGAGAIGILYALYQGVALVLRPDITKGFGLYVLTSMLLLLFTALAHFVAVSVLEGKLLA